MLLFYSKATCSLLELGLIAAPLSQGSFKNMKTSIRKDLFKSKFVFFLNEHFGFS